MRRCYAHVPAAENPLRPEAPKSPWSRRIVFPAPSGHFRIVLFLIGLIGCLCLGSLVCRSVYRFFFVLCPASVSYGFVLWLLGGFLRSVCFFLSFAFRWFLGRLRFSSSVFPLGGSCRSSVPRFPLLIRSHPFHGFVFPPPFPFFIRFPFSGFPFVFVFLFSSFSFAWLACSFPFRGFRLRSGRFVFVLRFRLSASPRRNAPSGGGVEPIGQGCPRVRGRPPRGWRGGAGPGSRTRAAMGVWGRRRRGGRRPMGSAGRRTRRRR